MPLVIPRTGKPGSTTLMIAIVNANYEIAALLLDKGADPNTMNLGWTPLHHLTFVRKPGQGSTGPGPTGSGTVTSLELARKLVAHGADVNARMTQRAPGGVVGVTALNMKGATPFLMASRSADVALMRLLAELGADPRLPNDEGSTPLIVAAGVGTHSPAENPGSEDEVLEAVKLALELGNDIDATDINGNTAMHGAAFKQVPAVVQDLADRGAKSTSGTGKMPRVDAASPGRRCFQGRHVQISPADSRSTAPGHDGRGSFHMLEPEASVMPSSGAR